MGKVEVGEGVMMGKGWFLWWRGLLPCRRKTVELFGSVVVGRGVRAACAGLTYNVWVWGLRGSG